MRTTSMLALAAALIPASAFAQVFVSVIATGGDTHAFNGGVGTFRTGDSLTVARNATTIYAPNPYTVPVLAASVPGAPVYAMTDRNHMWTGFGTALTAAPNPANFPSYLNGLSYIMTMNGNRDNASFRIDVTTSSPGKAYLFIDNRLGDGAVLNALDAPNPSGVAGGLAQWIINDGWTFVTTGLKPADYTGANDILGIDENGDLTIDQYLSIYSKDISGTTFSTYTFGEGRDMYGIAFAPVPEPQHFALVFGAGLAGFAAWRRRTAK